MQKSRRIQGMLKFHFWLFSILSNVWCNMSSSTKLHIFNCKLLHVVIFFWIFFYKRPNQHEPIIFSIFNFQPNPSNGSHLKIWIFHTISQKDVVHTKCVPYRIQMCPAHVFKTDNMKDFRFTHKFNNYVKLFLKKCMANFVT